MNHNPESTAKWRKRYRDQGDRWNAGKESVILDGDQIRYARERLELTVEQMAERLGVEAHVLSGIEKGYRKVTRGIAQSVVTQIDVLERRRVRAMLPVETGVSPTMAAIVGR